ncbi:MAG: hypothetical protein SFY67_10565 [Candidatus Melainabacteria bacterium]|nr:hypothetical protein [Candidatus Melainabacteria bacterium]
MCKYAKHNIDADFAMVSSHLLCGNAELWSLAKRYPCIEQKIERVIAFYQRLDPKMDKEYFKQLALKSET